MSAGITAVTAAQETRKPSPFTSGVAVVVYVALVRIILYGFAGHNYGYFRDELYYLACGEHPAWGYVDQPPLIAWIAWLLQHSGPYGYCPPSPALPASGPRACSRANWGVGVGQCFSPRWGA